MSEAAYLNDEQLQHLYQARAPRYESAKAFLVGLFTDNPFKGGSEVKFDGYTRMAVARNDQAFAVNDGKATIAVTLQFPRAKSSGPSVRWLALMLPDGQVVQAAKLDEPVPVVKNLQIIFDAGAVSFERTLKDGNGA